MMLFLRWFGVLVVGALLGLPQLAGAQAGVAELSGQVQHPTADTIAVSLHPYPLDPREQIVSAHLDAQGKFQLRVAVPAPVVAELVYDNESAPLFLEAGNVLKLKFQAEKMGTTLKFQSDDAAQRLAVNANNYLAEIENRFIENEGFQVLPDNIQLYETPFVSFLDYRRKQQLDFLKERGARQAFTPAFAAYAKAEIDYAYANDRLTYQDLREQVVNTEGRLKLSPTYFDFLKDPALVPGDEVAVTSEQYLDFLLNYVHFQARAAGHPSTDPAFYPASYQVASQTVRGALRPLLLGRVLLETFRLGHIEHSRALLADYEATGKATPAQLALLRQDLDSRRTLAIGAPAPPLALTTVTGDSVKLSIFAGQLVYLTFWDSRNPLCQREMPFLKDLSVRFAGQPIVFLCASVDADESIWLRALQSRPLPGTQVRVPTPLQAQVRQAYGVQQLPSFVLLAADGTILDPRPKRLSSRALVEDLKEDFTRAAAYRAATPTTAGRR